MYFVGIPFNFLNMYNNDQRYKAVVEEFKKMPNIEIISISQDNEDKIVSASIQVKGKGIIGMVDLHDSSFRYYPNLFINRIASWKITSACYRQRQYVGSTSFNIGSAGKESIFFPFKMNSVQDVIDHYDEIMTLIQTWPKNIDDPRMPGIKNKVTEGDTNCYFSVKDVNE